MSEFPSRNRRTQEERSAQTRQRILDATLECLVEVGYAATSTPEVCRRAGMSRGALLHHFPSKTVLVTHAMAHLAQKRAADLRSIAGEPVAFDDPLDRVFDLMWAAFTGPLFHAALELWVAARSDPELRAALYPVERSTGKRLYNLWRLLPDNAFSSLGPGSKHFDDLLGLTLHMLRGMALQKLLREDDAQRLRLFATWKAIAKREMAAIRASGSDPAL